jgi:hypothetical protein
MSCNDDSFLVLSIIKSTIVIDAILYKVFGFSYRIYSIRILVQTQGDIVFLILKSVEFFCCNNF